MSHVRTQIRTAAAAALGSIAPVSVARVYKLDSLDLPHLLVETNNEEFTEPGEGPMGALHRSLELVVTAVAAGDNVDEQLDDLIIGVEEALSGSTLGGVAVVIMPRQIEFTLSGDGAKPIGRARFTFEAVYRTSYSDPETSI